MIKKSLLSLLLIGGNYLAVAQTAGTWVQQPLLPTGYDVNNWVQFVDAVDSNVCWGLSASRNGQTNPLQVFVRTVDGGTTWTFNTITGATGLGPSSICAINADTAWATMFNPAGGGGIYKTMDGGISWVHQATATFTPPAGFPNIAHFFDGNNGISMGDPNGGYFEIYTTIDGGTNWVRTPQANIPAHQPGEFGITDVYTALAPSTLWFGTNQGRIYKTVDGGLNWTVAATPYLGFIGGIAFKDANYGIACESDLGTVNTDMVVTTDGGATWNILNCVTGNMAQKQSVTYVPGTDSTFMLTTPYNSTVAPLRDFGSAFSTNNGNSWYVVSQNAEVFSDNDFAAANGGWAGGLTELDPVFNLFRDPVMFKWTGALYIPTDDAVSQSIDVPVNTGITTSSPMATFLNNGLNTSTFNVTMTITGGYSSTKPITALAFNAAQQITFDPWTPAASGPYTITVYTSLAGDVINSNDTLSKVVTVYPEFLNYGWISRAPILTSQFGISGAFDYVGTYPSGVGSLYMIGGADLATTFANNTKFDVAAGTWSVKTPMPSPKNHMTSHRVGNKIYSIGGFSAGFTPDANTYIYDITADSWTTGAPMPNPVGDYASGIYNDSLIYYICGYNGAADQNTVQIYNTFTDAWTTGTNFLAAAEGMRGAIYQDKIVVAGGYAGAVTDAAYQGVISSSNPSVITWTSIANYPGGTAFRLSAGITYGETRPLVVFCGGDPFADGLTGLQEVWGYDLISNGWYIGPAKPTALNNTGDFVGTIYNDSLYLTSVSGYNGATVSDVNEWLNMGSASVLGINDLLNQNENTLVAYPNPSGGIINVVSPSKTGAYKLEVFNSLGEKVFISQFENVPVVKVDLSKLPTGMYFIRAADESKYYSAKVVLD